MALKADLESERGWTYAGLSEDLGMSASEVHAALGRCDAAGLFSKGRRRVKRRAMLEFLVHGVRYAFFTELGALERGTPTAHSASPLRDLLADAGDQAAAVWPDAEGVVLGQVVAPLHRGVPAAARRDPALHELLSLVDALRVGRARERELAAGLLEQRLA